MRSVSMVTNPFFPPSRQPSAQQEQARRLGDVAEVFELQHLAAGDVVDGAVAEGVSVRSHECEARGRNPVGHQFDQFRSGASEPSHVIAAAEAWQAASATAMPSFRRCRIAVVL